MSTSFELLREKLSKTVPQEQKPFPLVQFIKLYYTANRRDVYCNYFEGLRLLRNYLGPIVAPRIDAAELAKFEHKAQFIGSYELVELAKHLRTTEGTILWIIMNHL